MALGDAPVGEPPTEPPHMAPTNWRDRLAKTWDRTLSAEEWRRAQRELRFAVAMVMAIVGFGALMAAGCTWVSGVGYVPDVKSLTVETKAGEEVSRTEVTMSGNPLMSLPAGLAVVGLVLIAPAVSWAVAPGSKITAPGGAGAEASDSEGDEPQALKTARPKVRAAMRTTEPEVNKIVIHQSTAVDQPALFGLDE